MELSQVEIEGANLCDMKGVGVEGKKKHVHITTRENSEISQM
jgi:hypothetical protein